MRVIAFSKNRPCQSDLLLRSLFEQVTTPDQLSVTVLYVAETSDYQRGYDQVARSHPKVHLHSQEMSRPIRVQILELLEREPREFFTFLLDDMVVIRPFGCLDPEFAILRKRSDVASLALRMHPGITYCQPLDIATPPPSLDAERTWDWRFPHTRFERLSAKLSGRRFARGDWAGSMFLDGYVYRYREFVAYFRSLPEIPYVTRLESVMLNQPLAGTRVVCYQEARVLNLAMNRVDKHSVYPHAGGSAEELNTRFLDGDRLAYDHLRLSNHKSCHMATEPHWLEK
jgi:hypothetical protein